jgi:hypothetical protein
MAVLPVVLIANPMVRSRIPEFKNLFFHLYYHAIFPKVPVVTYELPGAVLGLG